MLLRLAVESRRWDLAAHTIILAAACVLRKGEKLNARKKCKRISTERR